MSPNPMSPNPISSAEQLDGFLAKYTPEVEAAARLFLQKMGQRLPGAYQLVYDNYNALAVGFSANEKLSGTVFSIAVFPRWVSLFFSGGPDLPDPHGLLKGSGTTVRHIVLTSEELFDSEPVQTLLNEALESAFPPIDPGADGSLIIKSVSAKQRPRRP